MSITKFAKLRRCSSVWEGWGSRRMEACGQECRGPTWAVAPTRRRRSSVWTVSSTFVGSRLKDTAYFPNVTAKYILQNFKCLNSSILSGNPLQRSNTVVCYIPLNHAYGEFCYRCSGRSLMLTIPDVLMLLPIGSFSTKPFHSSRALSQYKWL